MCDSIVVLECYNGSSFLIYCKVTHPHNRFLQDPQLKSCSTKYIELTFKINLSGWHDVPYNLKVVTFSRSVERKSGRHFICLRASQGEINSVVFPCHALRGKIETIHVIILARNKPNCCVI